MVPVPQNMDNNSENGSTKAEKRKIETDGNASAAKQSRVDDDEEDFNSTRFKFLLKNWRTTARDALDMFVDYASVYSNTPDEMDIVADYCELSDDGNEILNLLNVPRLQTSMIVSIFDALRCILVRVADNLVNYKKLAYNIAQKLLNVHMEKICKMLSSSHMKSKPIKSTLKLLTAIVVLSENSARNVLNKFNFGSSRLIKSLLERRNVLDEQDIRTCFLHFIMSFLMTASDAIIHDLVCDYNVIAAIIPGLRVDKFSVIELVLPLIVDKVVKNELITKSEKVKVFSSEVLSHLARAYNWLGPKEWKKVHRKVIEFQQVEESPSLEMVREAVHRLLLELCTSPKNGIIFFDKTFGTSGRDQNRTIRLFLQDVHVMPVFEDSNLKDLLVKIFQVCPEQMQPFLMQLQNSTVPRASLRWLKCMDFLEKILESLPDIPPPLKTSRKMPVEKLLTLVQNVVLPPQEILQPIILSIGSKELLIRHRCLQYTLRLMKKMGAIIEYCTNGSFLSESKIFTKADVEIFSGLFVDQMTRALPTVKSIFESWQAMNKEKSADSEKLEDLPEVDPVEHVILIEQTLCLYQTLRPETFSDYPVTAEIFDQVQKLCQTWKQQEQSDDAVESKPSEEKSYQQTRVRLYLLKLFANADARKIPWNKKNEDGQPLLYFLLDMLLTTINNDHQLLSIIKQLICQLLYHSGLFHCLELELHLWMDWLIKCGQDESLGRNDELLKFVANVFTQYICNPYPYIEKVFELLSEASLIEVGSDNNGDLLSTSTIDDFIDRMNEFDDEELGLNEHPSEQNVDQNSIKLPFSPLIIVAMKEAAQKSDAEIKPLKNYLQSVLIDLFHSQTNPVPLGILVKEERKRSEKHCWISKKSVSYIKSWLPDSKPSKKEKTVDADDFKDERSSVLLQALHQNGKILLDNSGFVSSLFHSVNQLNVFETLRAAQQSLRYIQKQLLQKEQDGASDNQDLSTLQLNFKFLKKVVKHLFRKCQHEAESDVPLALVSEDFQSLQIETFAVDRMLSEILTFLSRQSAIQRYFLMVEPVFAKDTAPAKNDTSRLLTNLVTKELTAAFSEFPKTSNKDLLNSYCTKIIAYLKECLLAVSKGRSADDISLAIMVLKHIIPYIDFATIQESIELLLQLPPEVLLSNTDNSDSGFMLNKLLNYLIQNCKTFHLEVKSLNSIYSILLHSESTDKLLTISKTLFATKPYYCLSCPSDVFVHLLTAASPEHLDLAMILLSYNIALDHVFVQWVLDQEDLKRKIKTFQNICITWCKLQKTLPMDKSKKCLSKISKASRKYLCAWISENNSENDTESSDNSMSLQLLQQFARLQAPGYKHMPPLESFKEIMDSRQTVSLEKLEIFVALTQWADNINDDSVDTAHCRIDVCLKAFLSSVRARVTVDRELELQLLNYLEKYLIDMPPQYNDLLLSTWMSFIRSSLRIYYSDPRVLRLLVHLIPKVYTEENGEAVSPNLNDLHQMLIGHSDFLPVIMGSESEESKELLIDILLMVIEREPQCCAESLLYVLMGAYGASLSTCDQKLLKMIYLYEKNGVNFTKLRPYLWGEKAIEMYELSKQNPLLNILPSTDRIFENIDSDKMLKSILHFPVKRKLSPLEVAPAEQWKSLESCYDPCFLLPVLSHLLASCNQLRSLHFMMKNCLGYTFAALCSHDSDMRAAGYHILTRLEVQLESSNFHRKEQYLHLLRYQRNSITQENTKLPFVNAIYMMKISQILLNEGHLLYASITAPLVVKPCQELNLVPEFFRMFNSSSLQHYHERMWILYLLHDGLTDSHDYRIYKKYYIFKIIMSFANSILCNHTSQFQILRILKRACELKTGAYDLTRHCGIVSWINNFISRLDPHSQTIVLMTEVIHTLWFSLLRKNVTDKETNSSADIPLPFVQEMQVVLLNLLQSYREGTSYAAMKYFLPLFASVLHFKKQAQLPQKEKTSEIQHQNTEEEGSKSEETDEKLVKTEAGQPHMKLELTPRDVLMILYQSRLHASNVQNGERSLDLLKRWGYVCDHLTEVSFSLQKQNSEKPDPDGNIQSELPDSGLEEETTTCSKDEQLNLQQALVDICLSWIPSKAFQHEKGENESFFDETLELVMTCLCEEAAGISTPLSSILDILYWIQTQLNHWNSAISAIARNTNQGNLPVFIVSLLSLHARLLSIPNTEQSANEIGTDSSATAEDLQKPVEALRLLSNICRTLSEKCKSLDGSSVSNVLQPFLEQIAAEYQT